MPFSTDAARRDVLTERALLEKIEELSLLRTLNDRLGLAQSFAEGCRVLVEVLGEERGAEAVAYHSVDWRRRTLRLEAAWPPGPRSITTGNVDIDLDSSPLAAAVHAAATQGDAVACGPGRHDSIVLGAGTRIRGKVNGVLSLHARGTPLDVEEDGRILAIVAAAAASALDVSRWLEREAFLAMLRHDINNPISVALGYGEMIADRVAEFGDPELDSLVGSVVNSLTAVAGLVARCLHLDSIDRGEVVMEPEAVDLAAIVTGIVDRRRPSAVARRIDLTCQAMPAPVEADRHQIGRLVENLVSNAIKYTPDGGRVAVGVSSDVGWATLVVRDTGLGIPEEQQHRAFTRHTRFHRGLGIPGSGLGLSICKAIVEAHGGTIHLESRSGVGSTFTVRLPR